MLYSALYIALRQLGFSWSQRYVTLALLAIVLFGVVSSSRQLYRSWRLSRLRVEVFEALLLLTCTFALLTLVLYIETDWSEDRSHLQLLALWYVLAMVGMTNVRAAMRMFLLLYRIGPADHRRVAFYGATETARRLSQIFASHSWMGIDVVGFYDNRRDPTRRGRGIPLDQIAGTMEDLLERTRAGDVSAIYIAMPVETEHGVRAIVDAFADTTVSIYYCLPMFDFNPLNAHWDDVFGHPIISIVASPFDGYRRHLKRLEDLVLALLILPVIALPLAVIALAVKLTSPGPVLYLQTRHGLGGKPFKICKFRTMYTTDGDGEFVQAKRNDSRITPLGAVLRRTSLDELPQFFNVLAGHMSVVGPRPAPVKYNEDHRRIIYRYMVRHKVKPGITGLAQVSGSRGETENLAKTEERTEYDLTYINTWSLWLDLRILWKTAVMTLAEFRPR